MPVSQHFAAPSASVLFLTLAMTSTASAQLHFTTPVPSFDDALAAAKQEGKPLVIEFSTSWCGPCRTLAKDLQKPRARPLLDTVHLVVYDGEGEPGLALMERFQSSSFPTLIAVDPSGNEASRRNGFSSFNSFSDWIKSLPDQTLPIAELTRLAAADPKNGKLQLKLGQRLLATERSAEARDCFRRARTSPEREIAAGAALGLLRFSLHEQIEKSASRQAEELAAAFPGTEEAQLALKYLAGLPSPSVAKLEALLTKHTQLVTSTRQLNSLAYIAMKGGAFKAARQIAEKLEPLAKDDAQYLDTLAELAFYASGQSEKAVAIEARAIEHADARKKLRYSANLERFQRNGKEPSEELKSWSSPSLDLPRPSRNVDSSLSGLQRARIRLARAIRERCWQLGGRRADDVTMIVQSAERASEHRVLYSAGAPMAFTACATPIVQSTELPAGETFQTFLNLTPAAFDTQLADAREAAESSCAPLAGKRARLVLALTAETDKPVALHFPMDDKVQPVSAELRACVDKAFAALKAPRALLQTMSLGFEQDSQ